MSLVETANPLVALATQHDQTLQLLNSISEEKALHRYAPGKWSIKEVLGHMIDAERVFAYRALRFARGDETPLPGFDQDLWMKSCNAESRSWSSLKEEYDLVRRSTIALFSSFDADAWMRRGTAWNRSFTVRAMAFIAAGHELNHIQILRERYLS